MFLLLDAELPRYYLCTFVWWESCRRYSSRWQIKSEYESIKKNSSAMSSRTITSLSRVTGRQWTTDRAERVRVSWGGMWPSAVRGRGRLWYGRGAVHRCSCERDAPHEDVSRTSAFVSCSCDRGGTAKSEGLQLVYASALTTYGRGQMLTNRESLEPREATFKYPHPLPIAMYVFRGRVADPEADRDATADMLAWTARNGEPTLRVWTPHRQVAFGRRDVRADGYETAAEVAREHGFEPYERSVGGRAVAYTGGTVAFARAEPVADIRSGMADRYEAVTTTVQRALWKLDVPVQRGEPADTFCPGDHSLSDDGKIVGIAQRVRKGAALVSGVIVVDGHRAIADVLDPVYDTLGVPFDPATVGSIERAGGRTDRETVLATVEEALVGDREYSVREVGDVPEPEAVDGE